MNTINESDDLNIQSDQDSFRSEIESKLIEIIQGQIYKYRSMNSENEEILTDSEYDDEIENSEDVINLTDLFQENTFLKQLNSITYIGAIVAIEKEFDIEFNDEELRLGKFQSLSDITDYILKRKSEQR